MNLEQAKEISRLSTAPTDECTLVPEFGVSKYCVMHDHLLQHFVFFSCPLNSAQIGYMLKQNLHRTVMWSQHRGAIGDAVAWKDANHLFREGLQEKIHTEGAWYKKIFYWVIRNVYYVGVVTMHRIGR